MRKPYSIRNRFLNRDQQGDADPDIADCLFEDTQGSESGLSNLQSGPCANDIDGKGVEHPPPSLLRIRKPHTQGLFLVDGLELLPHEPDALFDFWQ
jgi:hypothetical protein